MKLLCELTEDVQILVEEANGKKNLYIEGITLQGDLKNKNGRCYPSHILEAEVNRYMTEKVAKNRAYGELGHPQGPQINLERVSHIFKSLRREGSNWIGKALVTEGTPYGAIVKGLLESGANLGVSSRGLGSLRNRNGVMEVCDDFRLATAGDVVADPSAPNAFVAGLMEDVEWILEGGVWKPQQLEAAKAMVDAASRNPNKEIYEQTAIGLFEKFIKTL